ncbi:MAG: hypothetical protein OHK0039_06730 [Bacteroidia bacterium]
MFFFDHESIPESLAEKWIEENIPFIAISGDSASPEARVMRVFGFSSMASLYAFTDSKGIPLREADEVTTHLSQHADSTGAIAAYEATGEVPEDYLDYQASYIEEHYGTDIFRRSAIQEPGFIHRECLGGGS